MRILYLGDIFGEGTIQVLKKHLNEIKNKYKCNLVFANAENVNHGRGMYERDYKELIKLGISAMSMGNHTYSKSDIYNFIEDANICRPANIYKGIGKPYININFNNYKITIINLLGRTFMTGALDCPFRTFDKLYEEIESDYIIVDFHAEASSEKIAFANYVKDRANLVLGTHTHVQTNDARIIGNNTLYITDIGMCGPYDSIIGNEIEDILERFITGIYKPARVATGRHILSGIVVDTTLNKIETFNEIYEE